MSKNKVRIIKATRDLQMKAGVGEIPPEKIARAERVLERDTTDFTPMGTIFLEQLHDAIQKARGAAGEADVLIQELVKPVMELKANARMFKYDLVGMLANVMLGFLEHIKDLDSDILDIIEAHHRTLDLIVRKKMSGDGGANGATLKAELENLCARYFSKNPDNFRHPTMGA